MKPSKVRRKIAFFMRIILAVAIIAGLIAVPVSGIYAGADTYAAPAESVPGEVLAPAASYDEALEIAAAYGLSLKSYAYGIAAYTVPDTNEAIARSRRMSGVLSGGKSLPDLSPNLIYRTCESDLIPYAVPDAAVQWHHGEMDTKNAWKSATGSGVIIAVIDTGINTAHPSFNGRILSASYNSHSDKTGLNNVRDDRGHGTHVAGIAAASRNDSAGVTGVAPDAQLLVIKANTPNKSYFEMASILRGINYAVENGADIINISFGRKFSDGGYDMERNAIINAVDNGVAVICAAGNSSESSACYPAAYPESIAVSATRKNYTFDSGYSNSGPEVDISAPGTEIYSATYDGGFGYMSGTSMATPNVAGTAALIKAKNPGYTEQQVREALYGTARDAGTLGLDSFYGYGIVNTYAAVLGADSLVTVTFVLGDDSGGTFVVKTAPGQKILAPDAPPPPRDGYIFNGWLDKNGRFYNFNRLVNADMTLTANYTKILSPEPTPDFDGLTWHIPADSDEPDVLRFSDWHITAVFAQNGEKPLIWSSDDPYVITAQPGTAPFYAVVKLVSEDGTKTRYIGAEKPVSVSAGSKFDGKTWLVGIGYAEMQLAGWTVANMWNAGLDTVSVLSPSAILVHAGTNPFNAIAKLIDENGKILYIGIER